MDDLRKRVSALSREQLALLSARLDALGRDVSREPRAPRGAGEPLSAGQLRMWAMHQAAPTTPINIVSQIVSLTGPLDARRLEKCLAAIVARHEALRTTIAIEAGQPVQIVHGAMRVELTRMEIPPLPAEQHDDEARRLAVKEAWTPFDLAAGPLVRFSLARFSPESHKLFVTAHNIIFDAWSFSVLLSELAALYAGEELAKPPMHAVDFARWQRRWLDSEERTKQVAYWREQLRPPFPKALSGDRPREAPRAHRGERVNFSLGLEIKERLGALVRKRGVTLFMAWAALVELFVHRLTGDRDVIIGSFSANRARPETTEAMGFFLNIVPLRASFAGDPSFSDLLAQMRKVALGAYANADVPYEVLADELGHAWEPGRNPLFDVLFSFENLPKAGELAPGLTVATEDADKHVARFDLTISIYDRPDDLHGWIEYDTSLFEPSTARRMVDSFTRLVAAALDQPERPVGELAAREGGAAGPR